MHISVPRRGVTMVEYALMLMLISLTSLLVVSALGTRVATTYDNAQQPMTTVTVGPVPPSLGGGGDTAYSGGAGGGTTASKGNHGNNGHHGNPGGGNNGNDKSVGNAPSNGGNGKP
jgi:Flp pilus assembly pilin Flp